jgi:AraC family transcriptional regulator, regulatory protein of adaptative response / methylphosphotriester-DNA alkyltransferase methyltransferase
MLMVAIQEKTAVRPQQILRSYLKELDTHIADLKEGRADRTFEIRDFASILNIHPRHLSNTINDVLGESPCTLFEERLVRISKELLLESDSSVAEIARRLTYDPSNFTKFFKRFVGCTPLQFRQKNL